MTPSGQPTVQPRVKVHLVVFIAWLGFLWLPQVHGAPVHLIEQSPVDSREVAPGVMLVDFGRVAFGNLVLVPPANATGQITVHFGEALADGRIDRKPPGSVRYARVVTTLNGSKPLVIAPPADPRNTKQPAAVLTPSAWGVVLPFRWVEIEGWPGQLGTNQIHRRAAFDIAWDDSASDFHCSNEMLNRIWDLCRYSIKATTFAGIYVDGDRERTAYEADAYFSQLGQYYTDGHIPMARDTFDRLIKQPTWPTEWAPHMIFIAYADWMQTGDTNWLAANYAALKPKLQLDRALPNGLMASSDAKIKWGDLVDWPTSERDNFVFTHANTVANAFHLRALEMMAALAAALHRDRDAADYTAQARNGSAAFQEKFFDPATGLYRDGEDTDHTSLHANLFPLAFGLVPVERRAHVAEWLASQGMKCSVYGAQYLMEGLFENGQASQAIVLMTAPGDRSWAHMVESGTTITWEAWDQHYKPNQDWNHAWGAAPANLLPRFVLGVQPLAPGWKRAMIRPNPGGLTSASGKVPTPLGPVILQWENRGTFKLTLTLPPGMSAQVQVPASEKSTTVFIDGHPTKARREAAWWVLENDVVGSQSIEVR